jgi:hypothetical protein
MSEGCNICGAEAVWLRSGRCYDLHHYCMLQLRDERNRCAYWAMRARIAPDAEAREEALVAIENGMAVPKP